MLARTDSRARALLLLVVATIVAGGIGTRLVWWQVVERDRLAAIALHQLAQNEEIPAARGQITDSSGGPARHVGRAPIDLCHATDHRGPGEHRRAAGAGAGAGRRRAALPAQRGRRLGLAASPRRASGQRPGAGAGPPWRRHAAGDEARLPDGGCLARTPRSLPRCWASSTSTAVGQYGIECSEDALLAGLPGSVTAQEDVIGRQIADSVYQLREPVDGSDLRLTIDAGLQHLLEAAMWDDLRAQRRQGRDRGSSWTSTPARCWRWPPSRPTTRIATARWTRPSSPTRR